MRCHRRRGQRSTAHPTWSRALGLAALAHLAFAALACASTPDWRDTSHEARLRDVPIVTIEPLQAWLAEEKGVAWEGSNPLMLVTLADGTHAVFRHEDEPWGSRAEVVGYRLARFLGLELVPPTVPRTLRRDALPVDAAWPWGELQERPGSLQVYVDAAPITAQQRRALTDEERADIELLSFLIGRYDNHAGNLLVDARGRPVMIDFEGALDRQRVRYGEHPFLKRGGRAAPSKGTRAYARSEAFPFDDPERLVDPSLAQIEATFGPWWGQYWPEGMRGVHQMLDTIPERTLRYVIWDERLWVQVPVASRHPAHTDVYPEDTLAALRELDEAALESILISPFHEGHLRDILDRRRQLLEAVPHDRGTVSR